MCVWCAYTGKKEAAPILDKMGKRIEGLWSGFYSGMVTQESDGLKMAKVAGCTRFWDERNSVHDFHGTCGLWHSRTNSGGSWRYGHPFVGVRGLVAAVSQGSPGYFASRDPLHLEMIRKFHREGMQFTTEQEPYGGKYYVLDNGKQIHVSDFVTQLTEKEYLRTGNPVESIRLALTQFQEEASCIMVFRDIPRRIFFATTSQRIIAAKYADGIALSITALAFGHNAPSFTEIPMNSVGYVDEDTLHVGKLSPQFDNIYDTIPDGCAAAMRGFLERQGPASMPQVCDKAIAPLFPKELNAPKVTASATYKALETLYFNNKIEIIPEEAQNPVNKIIGRADKIKLTGM